MRRDRRERILRTKRTWNVQTRAVRSPYSIHTKTTSAEPEPVCMLARRVGLSSDTTRAIRCRLAKTPQVVGLALLAPCLSLRAP